VSLLQTPANRPLDQADRLITGASCLMQCDPQQMQRISMVAVPRQYLAISRLGVDQPPGSMMTKGILE
jgi:hypothetical protein